MEIHNDKGRRFYTTVEGGDAHILYRWGDNGSYDLFATYVPTQSRGHNIADKMVREAIHTARTENVKIIDTCPYVKSWFRKHPEEADILVKSSDNSMTSFY
ncbi:MAG: GNAT family N-acetyltransferase [Bdellovibrio sp.]